MKMFGVPFLGGSEETNLTYVAKDENPRLFATTRLQDGHVLILDGYNSKTVATSNASIASIPT